MDKKKLTEKDNMGKLSLKEQEIKAVGYTGRLILIVDCNQGGVRNIEPFIKSDS